MRSLLGGEGPLRRVLVVSPDPELRALLCGMAASCSLEVYAVPSLQQAREAVRRGRSVDLAILDPLTTRRAYFAGESVSLRPFTAVAALLLDPAGRTPLGIELAVPDLAALTALFEAARPAPERWLERCA